VGVKNGKNIYRDTYCLRLPEYSGQFVKFKGEIYKARSIGKKVELEAINGETQQIFKSDVKKISKLAIDLRDATVIYHDKNSLYIMDSKDYVTHTVNKPKNWTIDKQIKIFEYDGNIYAVCADD
jgi:NMD protein affecting ribosome stability and mRNA decay